MTTIETMTQARDDARNSLLLAYDMFKLTGMGVRRPQIGPYEQVYTTACEALATAQLNQDLQDFDEARGL